MTTAKCKLSPVALGLALGVFWGLSILAMGLLASYFMYGTAFVTAMGNMYVGYEASVLGSVIGGFIGFVDAFIGGAIIGWLYNVFSGCCGK
ncbi:MAG: bacteriophage holin [Legionellaceae bacterium]|nr:bacteriophage holin [Legionellaceae bacterium]